MIGAVKKKTATRTDNTTTFHCRPAPSWGGELLSHSALELLKGKVSPCHLPHSSTRNSTSLCLVGHFSRLDSLVSRDQCIAAISVQVISSHSCHNISVRVIVRTHAFDIYLQTAPTLCVSKFNHCSRSSNPPRIMRKKKRKARPHFANMLESLWCVHLYIKCTKSQRQ